eukprot:TRINITY_DN1269_c0_g1_i5.p1 TRINITY_DN1269_c0_g1~~TRINITY_DN1269_c0_g1_i5.p1  ORF type:complete len:640 (+),score=67.36 TRINITY_DN1269_c0_g1_i5:406-2325(+)
MHALTSRSRGRVCADTRCTSGTAACSGHKSFTPMTIGLIKNPDTRQRCSASITKFQTEFVEIQTEHYKEAVQLAKHWRNGLLWSTTKTMPKSYVIELLVLHAYESLDALAGSATFELIFKRFLEIVISATTTKLRLFWTKYYERKHIPDVMFVRDDVPLVLDPANPTNNVAESFEWHEFVYYAKQALQAGSAATCEAPQRDETAEPARSAPVPGVSTASVPASEGHAATPAVTIRPVDDDSRSAEELQRVGNTAFKSGQLADALALYERALAADPPLAQATTLNCNAAMTCLKLGEAARAVKFADACLRLDSRHAKGHLRRAQALYKLGRDLEAQCAATLAASFEKSFAKEVSALIGTFCSVPVFAPAGEDLAKFSSKSGVLIVLTEGSYRLTNNMLLSVDSHLVGLGACVIISEHEDVAITTASPKCLIDTVTIRSMGSCLSMTSGSVTVTRCRFSCSDKNLLMAVHATACRFTMRDCEIFDCTGCGLGVVEDAVGLVEDLVVSRCGGARTKGSGIELHSGGSGVFRRVSIRECYKGLMAWARPGVTVLEDCTVADVRSEGIFIHQLASSVAVTLRRCKISGSHTFGVSADSYATVILEQCEVSENMFWGVNIKGCSNVSLSDCIVHNNHKGGVHMEG